MPDEPITDADILRAMQALSPDDSSEDAARRVVVLFARRTGRSLTEAEIEDGVRRVLGILKLPVLGSGYEHYEK